MVAKGFTQKKGIDYNEIFSLVVKHSYIKILLAIVVQKDWKLHQLDVKTTFLYGNLEETIYMEQPDGFIKPGDEGKVCLLKKSLYGLKQSSRQWYLTFNDYIQKIGFEMSKYDNCVFIKNVKGSAVGYLLLYVDDMLVSVATLEEVQGIKDQLKIQFDMKNLGCVSRILGMDIVRNRKEGKLWLTQRDYISRVLKKFQIDSSKPVTVPFAQQFKLSASQSPDTEEGKREMEKIPYSIIVGNIMYTMIYTRPDLSYAISVASRFMENPGMEH